MSAMLAVALVLSALISFAVCAFARPVAMGLGVVDVPDGRRKAHRRRTPLVGGIAVCPPLVAMLAVAAAFQGSSYQAALALVLGHFVLGFLDDRRPVPAVARLAAALLMVLVGLGLAPELRVERLVFAFAPAPVVLGGWALLFTLVSVVGLTNAVNMADGQNGLVIGLALIWTALIASGAPPPLIPALLVLATGLAVSLVFNMQGRLFLGDAGTYGISVFIGIAAIVTYHAGGLDAGAVMMLFLIPVIDCVRLMAVRWLGAGTPFAGDRNHLHHRLQRLLPVRAALLAYWALVGVPAGLAVAVPSAMPVALVAALGGYGAILWAARTRRRAEAAVAGGA